MRTDLFEKGQPRLVHRKSFELEGYSRRSWYLAGARFERPEFECSLVNFWQRERSKRFRRLDQDLRRRLQLLNPSPTAITSSRCDDTFSPTTQPFEQHPSISL